MGYTIGDVLAVLATIFGVFLTLWATAVATALLCPRVVERARSAAGEPRRIFLKGVLLTLLLAAGVVLLGAAPLVKLVGWVVVLGLLSVAAIGLAGIARLAADRITQLDDAIAGYAALVRGAAFVVGATNLPILGWLVFGPVLLVASLGAGWNAVAPSRAASPEVA